MLKRTDENQIIDSSDEPVAPSQPDEQSGKLRTVLSLVIRGGLQIVLMIAVLAGSFVFMNRIIDSKPETRKRPKFRTVYTINTVPVELGDHRPIFTVYGETIASRTVDLRSLVSGEVTAISIFDSGRYDDSWMRPISFDSDTNGRRTDRQDNTLRWSWV